LNRNYPYLRTALHTRESLAKLITVQSDPYHRYVRHRMSTELSHFVGIVRILASDTRT